MNTPRIIAGLVIGISLP